MLISEIVRRCRLHSLCVSVVCLYMVNATIGADDPYADVWKTHTESIGTLEASFAMTQPGEKTSKPIIRQFRIDLQTGMYSGHRLSPMIQGSEEVLYDVEYGGTSKVSWRTMRQPSNIRAVYITKPKENGSIDYKTDIQEIGFYSVQKSLLPLHLTRLDTSRFDIQYISTTNGPIDGSQHIEYAIQSKDDNKTVVAKLIYDVDLSDGVKLLSMSLYNKDMLVEQVKSSDWKKVDGFWIPIKSTTSEFTDGKLDKETGIEIENIAVNKRFSESDFLIKLEDKDYVRDTSRGEALTYSYKIGESTADALADPAFGRTFEKKVDKVTEGGVHANQSNSVGRSVSQSLADNSHGHDISPETPENRSTSKSVRFVYVGGACALAIAMGAVILRRRSLRRAL